MSKSMTPRRLFNALSYRIGRGLRGAWAAVDGVLWRFSQKSGALSALYYGLASTRFRREQSAFLAGRARYLADLGSERSSQALLRRNTHRIEKGLCMRPRRPLFAAEYIDQMLTVYRSRMLAAASSDECRWASAVLTEYFTVVDLQRPQMQAAKRHFERTLELAAKGLDSGPAAASDAGQVLAHLAPFQRDLPAQSLVPYESLLALSRQRRSVRAFLPKPVPRELVEQAMLVALQSPTACNRQPFSFRYFDDPEWVLKVAKVPMGVTGYEDQIPAIIVVVGQMRNFFDERDRHLIYIDGALASMSFILAAETLGLATCSINWPDMEEKEREMASLIKLDSDERPVMLLAVGYPEPSALVPSSVKRPVGEVLRYNFE